MKKLNILIYVLLYLGMETANAQLTILHNFDSLDGAITNYDIILNSPVYGSLTLAGKKLYGMTPLGGLLDGGVIFSIDTNGNSFKDLYNFDAGAYGWGPEGSLIISGSKLYGMTKDG